MAIDVVPGTVVLHTDIVCAWSALSLRRFYAEQDNAGLTDALRANHRLFPLEDLNRIPIPKNDLDAETPVVETLDPELGWRPWHGDPPTWPISLLHEILDIATGCPAVNVDMLGKALNEGRAWGPMIADDCAHHERAQGSPHWFQAAGTDVHNPGITLHWVGEAGAGFPVVDADELAAMGDLVRRAAAAGQAPSIPSSLGRPHLATLPFKGGMGRWRPVVTCWDLR